MRQLSLILLLACGACRSAAPSAPVPVVAAPVAAAMPGADLPVQMRALVGSAACSDSIQCKTVPMGARACGGPETYLAYSTVVTPTAPLQALAERYAQQRRDELARSGMASTCQFIPDPGAQCRAGTCVLGTAAGGS